MCFTEGQQVLRTGLKRTHSSEWMAWKVLSSGYTIQMSGKKGRRGFCSQESKATLSSAAVSPASLVGDGRADVFGAYWSPSLLLGKEAVDHPFAPVFEIRVDLICFGEFCDLT